MFVKNIISDQVKAERNSSREWYDEDDSPPRTPLNDQEPAANSLVIPY